MTGTVRYHVWPETGELVWCSDEEFAALRMYDGLIDTDPETEEETA